MEYIIFFVTFGFYFSKLFLNYCDVKENSLRELLISTSNFAKVYIKKKPNWKREGF